ncbi:MAG: PKD domain-containing protein [Bacteroidetes bacterium]|nr:PKD domain-containing protein [Bacteroidota bacterium]
MKRRYHICLLVIAGVCVLYPRNLKAQCSVDFASASSACLQQQLLFQPNSVYSNYDWDFCAGDLDLSPAATVLVNSYGGYGFKVEIAEQNNNYYGFILTRATNRLYRIDFGNNIKNPTPAVTDLGGLGINSSTWRVIEVVAEGGKFYGFISDNNLLYRIDFGTSLSNAPSNAVTIFSGAPISSPIDMTIVEESGSKYLFLANLGNETLVRLKFNSSYLDIPVLLNPIQVTGSTLLSGISFLKDCSTWYATATAIGVGKVYQLVFNAGIEDPSPTISSFLLNNASGISLVQDNSKFYAFIQSQSSAGTLHRVNFGNGLSSPPTSIDDLSLYSSPKDLWGFSMYKAQSDWLGLATDGSGPNVYSIIFPSNCFSSTAVSQVAQPVVLTGNSGTFNISLRVKDGMGNWTSRSHPLTITSGVAPDISLASQNVCANYPVNFSSSNVSGNIVNYSWDFGDAATAAIANPSHTYAAAGVYTAQLTVTASNSCTNVAMQSVQIFNAPNANFNLPGSSPICTNAPYTLTNTATFDPGSNPTWEWRLNGNLISTQKDLVTSFSSPTAQQISLKAFIPGCNTESIQNIPTVLTGPAVGFNVSDDCMGNTVAFQNVTTGADAGYLWDFGDGSTSTQANPGHLYTAAANYNVTLTANNSIGCQIAVSKSLKISSLPQPDFSVGLPPFSCSQSATPFQNTTSPLTDSNITTWNWSFGDLSGGTSTSMTPSYTYTAPGTYLVQLTATSDAGCIGTQTKSINIASSPVADFTFGPTCINQLSRFSDQSGGGVQSRVWQINSSTFTTTNPTYTFSSAGTFPAMLTVTGSNGCANVKSKSVFVPQASTGNFSLTNPCAGQPTQFTDASITYGDVVTGWNWNFAGNSIGGNPANYVFSLPGNYNVKMTTTHASGCQYTTSKTIGVNPTPVAAFTATPDRGSAPLTVQFNNLSTGATSYQWTFFDKIPSYSTRSSDVYTYSSSLGTYSAQLKASNALGCSDTKSVPIIILNPVIDLILYDISLVTDPVSGKLKCKVSILNNSNIPFYGAEVALFLSNKAVVNENLQFAIQPGESTTQTLSFTFSATQSDLNYICAEILLEKDTAQDNNKRCLALDHEPYFFDPYPNPTSGTVRIDWVEEGPGTAVISVYDNQGKRAYRWETPCQAGLNQTVHDLSFLTSGLYVVIVETSQSRKVMRFVRQ